MRERDWSADAAGELAVVVRAAFGVWRIGLGGERRAVSRTLEPTEQVLAVAVCGFEIVRQGAVAHRSMAALGVVTDRRLIFARKFPFRPARLDEVARWELRGATVEADASDRRVAVAAGAIRITMRHLIGRDAVDAMAVSLGVPTRDAPDETEASHGPLPPPEPPQPLGPGSRLRLVALAARGVYHLQQDDRVVARIVRPGDGAVRASRAGGGWRFRVRDVRGGWVGVAEDEGSGDQLASYRSGRILGGTLTLEGREHRLRRALSGAWRLRTGGTDVAVMRGEDPSAEVELAAGVTQVADPILLVVMVVWATWLEAELGSL